MAIELRQSTAGQEIPIGYFLDSTDGNTEETGLTIANTDIKVWKWGATTLASKNSGGATHISNGIYYAVLDATDTNTLGPLVVFVHVSGALAARVECSVLTANQWDSKYSTDALQVDVIQVGGTTQTARDLGASVLLSPGTGTGQISLTSGAVTAGTVSDKTGYSLTATTGLGNQTANITGNLSGSVGSISGVTFPTNFGDLSISTTTGLVDITQTAADKAWSTTTRVLTANTNLNDPTAAAIRSEMDSNSTRLAAIETDTQDIQSRIPAALVGGRVDANMGAISTSAAAADNLELSALQMIPFTVTGTPTSTVVAASGLTSSTTADDQLIGRVVIFTSGNAQYEVARITDYVHATGTMTMTELAVTPAATDTGIII